jgi:hypothetical protein
MRAESTPPKPGAKDAETASFAEKTTTAESAVVSSPILPEAAPYDRLIQAISLIAAARQMLSGVPEEIERLDRELAEAGVQRLDPEMWLPRSAPSEVQTLYLRAIEVGVRMKFAEAVSRVPVKGSA